jgi:DNA-binding SARP family transcriptional activator
MMLKFKLLGLLRLETDQGPVPLSGAKLKQLLGLLLVRSPMFVDVGSIIEELWPYRSPRSALPTVQTYVYQLRKMLAEHGEDPNEVLVTADGGYLLRVARDQLDVTAFEDQVRRGRSLLECGRLAEASEELERALAVWEGAALADVTTGPLLETEVMRLESLREGALELRIEADLRNARLAEVIPELQTLIRRYPLREQFHQQLVTALNRAGRRADALRAYQHTCQVLNDELGLDPSEELRRIHHLVLTGKTVDSREKCPLATHLSGNAGRPRGAGAPVLLAEHRADRSRDPATRSVLPTAGRRAG